MDFASLFYVYLSLENGVSQASRYGVTGQQMDDPLHPGSKLSHADSMIAAMRAATPTLNIPSTAFSFSNMPVGGSTWVAGSGAPGTVEKITVDYTWDIVTPLIRPFFTNGQIHFRVESAMKNEVSNEKTIRTLERTEPRRVRRHPALHRGAGARRDRAGIRPARSARHRQAVA
jgi:Flp pilus assembly protein TadG